MYKLWRWRENLKVSQRSVYIGSFEKIEEGTDKEIIIKMVKMWRIEEKKKEIFLNG